MALVRVLPTFANRLALSGCLAAGLSSMESRGRARDREGHTHRALERNCWPHCLCCNENVTCHKNIWFNLLNQDYLSTSKGFHFITGLINFNVESEINLSGEAN